MKMEKRRPPSRVWFYATVLILCVIIAFIFLLVLFLKLNQRGSQRALVTTTQTSGAMKTGSKTTTTVVTTTTPPVEPLTYPAISDDVVTLTEKNITATSAVLLDVDQNIILAERDPNVRIYPASMTKIMTLLVAAEHIEDYDDTFTMTYEIIAPLVEQNASRAGFAEGETVPLIDLMYGIALPSGADATIAIAQYVSGSEEAFVELMNEKVHELGLENTHFVNTSGLHDLDHYSTATDIALLMTAVMENDMCREILSTYQYTTTITEEHPEGIPLESTMFSRMYGTECEGIIIEAGKTGYTDEAGQCLVSYATDEKGKRYVAVVSHSMTRWRVIYDTLAIYGLITGGYPMPSDLSYEESSEADEEGDVLQ